MTDLVLAQKLLLSVYEESGMKGKANGAAEMAGVPGGVHQSCSVRREWSLGGVRRWLMSRRSVPLHGCLHVARRSGGVHSLRCGYVEGEQTMAPWGGTEGLLCVLLSRRAVTIRRRHRGKREQLRHRLRC